jgi:sideroflexin-5
MIDRLLHAWHYHSNPLGMLCTEEDVADARRTLERESSSSSSSSERDCERARRIMSLAANAESGQVQPVALRRCSYAVCNAPIIAGMLLFQRTRSAIVFWQLANQAYTAGVNWANASGSDDDLNRGTLLTFALATVSSSAVALGAKNLLNRGTFQNRKLAMLAGVAPLAGVWLAGTLNLLVMRRREWCGDGAPLRTDAGYRGDEIARSVECGRSAVAQTALSRLLLPLPGLALPPVLWALADRFVSNRRARSLVRGSALPIGLFVALPLSLAPFDAWVCVDADRLPDELRRQHGKLYYYRGL